MEETKKRSPEEESGEERQERLHEERDSPKQNKGYDDAVRTPGKPNKHAVPPDQRPRRDI